MASSSARQAGGGRSPPSGGCSNGRDCSCHGGCWGQHPPARVLPLVPRDSSRPPTAAQLATPDLPWGARPRAAAELPRESLSPGTRGCDSPDGAWLQPVGSAAFVSRLGKGVPAALCWARESIFGADRVVALRRRKLCVQRLEGSGLEGGLVAPERSLPEGLSLQREGRAGRAVLTTGNCVLMPSTARRATS